MELLPADYVLCAITLSAAGLGLFRGFSGTVAFVVAFAASGIGASLSWKYSLHFTQEVWMRAVVSVVATLLVFGLVRVVVKKLINGILAQPSDALFGFLIGFASGAAVTIAWAWSGMFLEYSSFASFAAGWFR